MGKLKDLLEKPKQPKRFKKQFISGKSAEIGKFCKSRKKKLGEVRDYVKQNY